MAMTPKKITVTSETTTEFAIEVPLILQGVNVKDKLDELRTRVLSLETANSTLLAQLESLSARLKLLEPAL